MRFTQVFLFRLARYSVNGNGEGKASYLALPSDLSFLSCLPVGLPFVLFPRPGLIGPG